MAPRLSVKLDTTREHRRGHMLPLVPLIAWRSSRAAGGSGSEGVDRFGGGGIFARRRVARIFCAHRAECSPHVSSHSFNYWLSRGLLCCITTALREKVTRLCVRAKNVRHATSRLIATRACRRSCCAAQLKGWAL